MDVVEKGIQLPREISIDKETLTDFYGKIIMKPLERGFGTTIGNSFRRVLLSSIVGAAVTNVRIPGVLHEFSTIKGVKEDMVDIILNIKKLRFKMHDDSRKIVTLKAKGPGIATGADIEFDPTVEVMNKDCYIAAVDNDATLEIEMHVEKGKGYVPSEMNKREDLPVDVIAIDAVFSPIKRVNFGVDKTRVGRITDYDRLTIEIWTDGSISPVRAASDAAVTLIDHFELFFIMEEQDEEEVSVTAITTVPDAPLSEDLLSKNVDALGLSVRLQHCLKSANINVISDLIQKTEQEMLKIKNLGLKSLNEIKNALSSKGLHLGMRLHSDDLY